MRTFLAGLTIVLASIMASGCIFGGSVDEQVVLTFRDTGTECVFESFHIETPDSTFVATSCEDIYTAAVWLELLEAPVQVEVQP